jgi:hypothetical protein
MNPSTSDQVQAAASETSGNISRYLDGEQPSDASLSRRRFLRRLSVLGLGSSLVVGAGELLGTSTAQAQGQLHVQPRRMLRGEIPAISAMTTIPDFGCGSGCPWSCSKCYGCCGSPCQPSGTCCYYCTNGGCAGYFCIGTCSTSYPGFCGSCCV